MSWFRRLLGRRIEGQSSIADFETLLAESEEYLSRNVAVHQQTWQYGSERDLTFDSATGLLTFVFDGGREVRCPTQAVGSFDTQANAWVWAWANTSVPADLRQAVQAVKAHGERHGFGPLAFPSWPASTQQAWQMTAVAAKICEYPGAYALSSGPLQIFLMFREVHLDRFELAP